jgi:hypothetical protein
VAEGKLNRSPNGPTLLQTRLLIGFINYVLETLGWLLFGIAAFRANIYPRALAITLVVGAPAVLRRYSLGRRSDERRDRMDGLARLEKHGSRRYLACSRSEHPRLNLADYDSSR